MTDHGQGVFTRRTANGHYVYVKGGTWLNLDPAQVTQIITDRFARLGHTVLAIETKLRSGKQLTTDEVTALRRFGLIAGYLAFIDPAMMRMLIDPAPGNDDVQIQYIGGVKVRTEYTLKEVAEITSDALKKPFSSFVKSAQDMAKKLNEGEALTAEEAENVERYAGLVDQFTGLTPQGQAMRSAGTLIDGLIETVEGRPLTAELSEGIMNTLNTRPAMTGALGSGTRTVPVKGRPASVPPVRPGKRFKDPVRLPDGRTGYFLGPTKPPRLAVPGRAGTSGVGRIRGDARPGSREAKKLAGKGPINLRPLSDSPVNQERIRNLRIPFGYYRNDRDVHMNEPRDVTESTYEDRRDVVTVGTPEEVTSYDSKSRLNTGKAWDRKGKSLKRTDEIIKIDNGREGVGAIAVPFSKIPPGGSVIVTSGMLSGCSVVMAADREGFYVYHAGSDRGDPGWQTATDGAAAIATAHNAMRPDRRVPVAPTAGSENLVAVGDAYPFSVIVHNSESPIVQPGTSSSRVNNMTTFNYHESDPKKSTIGTAEAVITKDMNGDVFVHVWAEKGTLGKSKSSGNAMEVAYKMDYGHSSQYSTAAPQPN
ncbi:cytotoxic necrotizing factor Rho-activating domain-containing protein [Paraburkholderia phytofirmans]|uniref:cytotoxic necrotizing factor Rho-activating domain-containing protein n=1 Tax=Paraburkholderia phytofirmans TaxID=261302 RepID=UPI0038BA14D2